MDLHLSAAISALWLALALWWGLLASEMLTAALVVATVLVPWLAGLFWLILLPRRGANILRAPVAAPDTAAQEGAIGGLADGSSIIGKTAAGGVSAIVIPFPAPAVARAAVVVPSVGDASVIRLHGQPLKTAI